MYLNKETHSDMPSQKETETEAIGSSLSLCSFATKWCALNVPLTMVHASHLKVPPTSLINSGLCLDAGSSLQACL